MQLSFFISLFITTITLRDIVTQMTCRQGQHKMIVLLTNNASKQSPIGLAKFLYDFHLLSSYDYKNNYQISFQGTFPINSNIDLNIHTVYEFSPEEYCLNHLIRNNVGTLKGNLTEYSSKIMVLTHTFVNVDNVYLNSPIDIVHKQENIYYVMNRVYPSQMPVEVILMKVLFQEIGAFYQLVRARAQYQGKDNINCDDGIMIRNEEPFIEVGTNITISLKDKENENNDSKVLGMKNGYIYTAITTVGSMLKYIIFDNVEDLVCLKGRNMDFDCDNNPILK